MNWFGFDNYLRVAMLLPALAITASGSPITITFDASDPIGGLSVGSILGAQYAASTGATFTANGFSGAGGPTGSWATNSGMQIVSSTGSDVGGLGTPSLVSGNLLRSFANWLAENGDPSFRISFATGVIDFSADFAGVATFSSTRVFAYDSLNSLLGTATAPAAGQQTLSLSGLGTISSVVITPGDFFDWVGVDNITFTPAASTPEPTTFGLIGFGLLCGALVRRRIA